MSSNTIADESPPLRRHSEGIEESRSEERRRVGVDLNENSAEGSHSYQRNIRRRLSQSFDSTDSSSTTAPHVPQITQDADPSPTDQNPSSDSVEAQQEGLPTRQAQGTIAISNGKHPQNQLMSQFKNYKSFPSDTTMSLFRHTRYKHSAPNSRFF